MTTEVFPLLWFRRAPLSRSVPATAGLVCPNLVVSGDGRMSAAVSDGPDAI
jgi:hypothetical protein